MRFFILMLAAALAAGAQTITTVAGNSTWGRVVQAAVDSAGNIYAADYDQHVIWKVDRQGGTTVVAGTQGTPGYAGDGGPARLARLSNPLGVAVAADGTIYIGDYGNDRIRRVAPNGTITTLAGTGVGGFTGDGGAAASARLNGPYNMVLDARGVLFFVDYLNYRVRRIGTDGVITTVAGSGRAAVSGDGGLATAADLFPGWLAVGPDGAVYVTDDANQVSGHTQRVRKVFNGVITTVVGSGRAGFSGDGGPATAALLTSADGVALDAGGNIYVSESTGARIRRVAPNGIITTYAGTGRAGLAGDGGPAKDAQLNTPTGLVVDAEGNLLVVDTSNRRVRKISPLPQPVISATEAAVPSFLGKAGFSSNTYVEIYGSNLSGTTRTWAGGDFNGANAPTVLDEVSVTVNGKAAFIYFISPGQININTPEDTATGPVLIQVKNGLGVSNVGTAMRARVSPTLQSVPQFSAGGLQFVVAQTADFRSFIGHPGAIPGVALTEARPGDSITIYALGCGPTAPATQAGVVAGQASRLALPFEVRIAGVAATVPFAGIVGGSIGLYQINVTVPNVPAGDHPIELRVDGITNGQNLAIAVGAPRP